VENWENAQRSIPHAAGLNCNEELKGIVCRTMELQKRHNLFSLVEKYFSCVTSYVAVPLAELRPTDGDMNPAETCEPRKGRGSRSLLG
jgi:hypothetical protein